MPLGAFRQSLNLSNPSSGRTARTVTTIAGAAVSNVQSKFGGTSLAVNIASVTQSRLTVSADSVFAFGTGAFTYECWIYPTTINGNLTNAGYIIDFRSSTSDANNLGINLSGTAGGGIGQIIVVGLGNQPFITGSGSYATNTWHHIAVTRTGTTVTVWVNGVSRGTTNSSASIAITGRTPTIGRGALTATQTFRGYIDEVRISNVARYTAGFTPSTTAFVNDANTVFLMHADGANGSTVFTDDNA